MTRFKSAIRTARAGPRVIERYSSKLGRWLQRFGEEAYRQWICLAVDPTVQAFCERPVYANFGRGKRMVDFLTAQNGRQELLIIDKIAQASPIVIDGTEVFVRTISPSDFAAARAWIGNWERMSFPSIEHRARVSDPRRRPPRGLHMRSGKQICRHFLKPLTMRR